MQRRLAMLIDRLAQRRRQRVDHPALQAVAGDHGLAALPPLAKANVDALERLPGKTLAQQLRPADHKAAIGRFQRRGPDAFGGEQWDPAAIGAKPRPARAAKRQHAGARRHHLLACRGTEQQRAVVAPAVPAVF